MTCWHPRPSPASTTLWRNYAGGRRRAADWRGRRRLVESACEVWRRRHGPRLLLVAPWVRRAQLPSSPAAPHLRSYDVRSLLHAGRVDPRVASFRFKKFTSISGSGRVGSGPRSSSKD